MTNEIVYKGDIVIINNKDNISASDNRSVLENGIPYFVTDLGLSKGTFYIRVYGKDIILFDTDMEHLDHVKVTKRYDYKVNNYVTIMDVSRISNAEKNGFNCSERYKVTKIIEDNGIVITNGKSELWVRGSELPYVNLIKNNLMVEQYNENNISDIQTLIDKALDERDFKTLEILYKNIK
ncbi:hypothetical protein ABNX05_11300 [Lysinibacillus sp. M3]|uniref:Uncharacterized protein n=1 Tax=Lysinibacillus zambalensis TaxID=3160866 RepID=A0ABV1MSV2_9BACI